MSISLKFYLLINDILSLLYPRHCPVCGRILKVRRQRDSTGNRHSDRTEDLSQGTPGRLMEDHDPNVIRNPYICPACFRQLRFPKEPRCLKCSKPIPDEQQALCHNCRKGKREFDRGAAILMHDETAQKILYELKYSNRRDYADMLGWEAAYRMRFRIRVWAPEAIIPVPLHRKREFTRGYNQAQVLAERFSLYLQEYHIRIPVDPEYLIRMRRTAPQKELEGERRILNIQDAFDVNAGEKPGKYHCVLLVDDIYTTGATLSECARVLKNAGIAEVYFLTFSIG